MLTGCNAGEVVEGKLYRSAQPDENDLEYLHKTYGIRTILNLRGESESFEREFSQRHGINLVEISMSARRKPSQEEIGRFFEVVDNPKNWPVIIHCKGGADRTGILIAIYRIERQGWSVKKAEEEMKRHWHIPSAHPQMFDYLDEKYGKK